VRASSRRCRCSKKPSPPIRTSRWLTKLAVVESNLGHPLKREEYAKRAIEHLDRLTPRERYYIEGYYYSNKADGFAKAITSYQTAIERYPDFASARHNLALLYSQLGRESDALPLYEDLRRRKMGYPTTYTNLAAVYRNLGQFDKASEVLREYVEANPTVPQGYRGLGDLVAVWGKYDEALATYDKAIALAPGDLSFLASKRAVFAVTDRWAEVDAINVKLSKAADPIWRVSALASTASERLYAGRSIEALQLLEQAVAVLGPRGSVQTASMRMQMAGLLMDKGQNGAALAAAQRALDDTNGIGPLSYQSLAVVEQLHLRLGNTKEAAAAQDELARRNAQLPSDDLREFAKHVQNGALASDRHDTATKIAELKLAEGRARPGNSNTEILFDLATAYLDAKDDGQAAPRLERIVTSGLLRASQPLQFVRSLYLLGQINERRGDRAKATGYYRRFVQYWSDGDLDRERVADARRKLGI
jgi:tetratricopeptide (TPR) repeat protein